jgi:RNase P protein component
MQERAGDLWLVDGDARVITTNGTLKADGRGVMGRGVAKQATERYPMLARRLGRQLIARGNHVSVLLPGDEMTRPLVTFPVKHQWQDRASLDLIARSARELVALTTAKGWQTVVLPRPGCGNGGLDWWQVSLLLAPLLDDRFVVVERPA